MGKEKAPTRNADTENSRAWALGFSFGPACLAGWLAGLFTQYYPSASIDSQVTRRQRV